MSNVNPFGFGGPTFLILVTLTILAFVELSQSCHRRVEYHHYYKKRPHKGHGHSNYGGGGHKGYGHHGHGGGHSHGKGYHMGGHDMKGYGGHDMKGYGGHDMKGYGGHDMKGYGGHDMKGYGGHDMKGYGGHDMKGYGGHDMKGYGGHDMKGYGGHDMKGYDGGGHHHGGDGYHGGGHHSHDMGDHGHGHGKGYGHHPHGGHGGHQDDAGNEDEYGQDNGHGHGGHKGKKGHKYKYQSYESTQYNDKGQGSQNRPHYMKQGYGYSGPYPNTEYSTPVEASVHPPDPDEIASGANINSFDVVGITPHLDAADTANLIRNSFDSKENDILSPSHNFGMVTGSSSLSTGGGTTGMSNLHGRPSGSSMIPTPTMQLSSGSSHEGASGGIRESKGDPSLGNFDLNLSYNSDLPDPFQKEFSEAKNGSPGIVQRKRKRISSKYRNRPSTSSYSTMDSGESQQYNSQVTFPQSDPMNDATESKKSPEMVDFMNF